MAVDGSCTLGAAHILPDHRSLGALRGPALVPKQQRQRKGFVGIAGKGTAGLCARAFATIHVARQAKHQPFDRAFGNQIAQSVAVAAPFAALDGLAIGGKAPTCITKCSADCLGPKVQPQQSPAIGQRIGKVRCKFGNQFACPASALTLLATSAFVFAQNKGMS